MEFTSVRINGSNPCSVIRGKLIQAVPPLDRGPYLGASAGSLARVSLMVDRSLDPSPGEHHVQITHYTRRSYAAVMRLVKNEPGEWAGHGAVRFLEFEKIDFSPFGEH